jgi:hypothetical protein
MANQPHADHQRKAVEALFLIANICRFFLGDDTLLLWLGSARRGDVSACALALIKLEFGFGLGLLENGFSRGNPPSHSGARIQKSNSGDIAAAQSD